MSNVELWGEIMENTEFWVICNKDDQRYIAGITASNGHLVDIAWHWSFSQAFTYRRKEFLNRDLAILRGSNIKVEALRFDVTTESF